jgi:hypothetical protein
MAGEDEETVKATWREAYNAGAPMPLDLSAESEQKTWQERVMKPYRDEIGRNRTK